LRVSTGKRNEASLFWLGTTGCVTVCRTLLVGDLRACHSTGKGVWVREGRVCRATNALPSGVCTIPWLGLARSEVRPEGIEPPTSWFEARIASN
jgi:hypothetical protein